MNTMNEWSRLAQLIEARRESLGMRKRDLYALTVSETTYRKLAAGVPIERVENRVKIALALGWTPDSVERILAGGEPVPSSPGGASEVPDLVARLDRLEAKVDGLRADLDQGAEALRAVLREGAATLQVELAVLRNQQRAQQ